MRGALSAVPLGCGAQSRHGPRRSNAKINDFKPTFGEVFAEDILRPYDWWGYLQEDILLGQLSHCLTQSVLRKYDIINSFGPPYYSSGVFMLFKNTREINRVWRRSANTSLVLSSPK